MRAYRAVTESLPVGHDFPGKRSYGQEHPGIFPESDPVAVVELLPVGQSDRFPEDLPFRRVSVIGISSGGIFWLSWNCFRSNLKFPWKVNRSRNFVGEIPVHRAREYRLELLPIEHPGVSEPGSRQKGSPVVGGVYQVGNLKRTGLRRFR